MIGIEDTGILALFHLAHEDEGASVSGTQKEAVEQLKILARRGNPDAATALHLLSRAPTLHPFLREVLAA